MPLTAPPFPSLFLLPFPAPHFSSLPLLNLTAFLYPSLRPQRYARQLSSGLLPSPSPSPSSSRATHAHTLSQQLQQGGGSSVGAGAGGGRQASPSGTGSGSAYGPTHSGRSALGWGVPGAPAAMHSVASGAMALVQRLSWRDPSVALHLPPSSPVPQPAVHPGPHPQSPPPACQQLLLDPLSLPESPAPPASASHLQVGLM